MRTSQNIHDEMRRVGSECGHDNFLVLGICPAYNMIFSTDTDRAAALKYIQTEPADGVWYVLRYSMKLQDVVFIAKYDTSVQELKWYC